MVEGLLGRRVIGKVYLWLGERVSEAEPNLVRKGGASIYFPLVAYSTPRTCRWFINEVLKAILVDI